MITLVYGMKKGLNQSKNIDKEILKILFKNPAKTLQWISQQVKVSTSTVARRYEHMKKENIIFPI